MICLTLNKILACLLNFYYYAERPRNISLVIQDLCNATLETSNTLQSNNVPRIIADPSILDSQKHHSPNPSSHAGGEYHQK